MRLTIGYCWRIRFRATSTCEAKGNVSRVLVSVAAHQAARVHALPRSAALLTLRANVLHRIAPSTAVVH